MNFTPEDLKLIYNAVKYYQMHRVPVNSSVQDQCNQILQQIFPNNQQ